MSSQAECPIPAVAEALEPYIKSREEVSAIRQALQSRIHREITTDDSPLSLVNLHTQHIPQDQTPSSAFTGLRRAYLKALQAHAAAQAKYDALRADIDKAKAAESQTTNGDISKDEISVAEDYLPLFRQRDRQRKLRVINRAFTDISAASGGLTALSLDRVVHAAGDPPIPPTSDANSQLKQQDWDVETRILELKKAIVTAKRNIQETTTKPPSTTTPLPNEVTGLQNALNELTIWMETQLSLISTNSTEAPKTPTTPTATTVPTPPPNSNTSTNLVAEISSLYNKYLSTRQSLIHIIHNPPVRDAEHFTAPLFPTSTPTNPSAGVHEMTPSETLLPYVKALLSAREAEDALVQQNAYVRRQINAGENETGRVLERLAEESRLLDGHGSGRDWAGAAGRAGEEMKRSVGERLRVGHERAEEAGELVEKVGSVPGLMDGLLQ